jgi:hypothetical protein
MHQSDSYSSSPGRDRPDAGSFGRPRAESPLESSLESSMGSGDFVSTLPGPSVAARALHGYAHQSRQRDRALGWVLWLGFAAVLVLSSL